MIYRPRMSLELIVPTSGDRASRRAMEATDTATTLMLQVRRSTVEFNDHNHADSLKVTVDWKEAGVDPRFLRNGVGAFYLGNADDRGQWKPGKDNLQFIGILTHPERRGRCGEAMSVELDFLDYTTLFIEAKPFGTKGVPDYSQNLEEAWRRICSQTPGADALAGQLRKTEEIGEWPVLGKAVAKRFAKLDKVPVKPQTDAWAVWQQCVGMMGLISYFDRDECIVTTATNYYTSQDPPRMIWGKNILAITEGRNTFLGKGIGLTSFDPLKGETIEALWPPVGDARVKRKKVSAKKIGQEAATRQAEEREWFSLPAITDPDALIGAAQRAYEERTRQELEGAMITAEMFTETVSKKQFGLLTLRTGNDIRIDIDEHDLSVLSSIPTESARVAFLKALDYSDDMALLIARNGADVALLNSVFFTKKVTTTIEVSPDSGQYETTVNFCNRILIDGNTAAADKA